MAIGAKSKRMEINSIMVCLEVIESQVAAIREMISQGTPAMPPEAIEKFRNGICLECGKPLKGEKSIRGCHVNCHQKVLREIRTGTETDFLAIASGRIAPSRVAGRPAQRKSSK